MDNRRLAIWNKSGGRCWYCGCQLPEKGWHQDHCDAVYRFDGKMQKPELHVTDNIVPACAPCNLFKGVYTVEEFRREIQKQVERARKSSVNFRTAERFRQITVNESPIVFWFEEIGKRAEG